MAITVTKAKPKAKPATVVAPVAAEVEPKDMTIERLADEYGEAFDRITHLSQDPVYIRMAELQEELKTRLAEFAPEVSLDVKGKHWLLEVGACSKSPRKVIDNETARKVLGHDVFMKLASISVGNAEKYMTPEQLEGVVSETKYTDNRKITPKYLG